MKDKCFCHLNGYKVKDAEAQRRLDVIEEVVANGSGGGSEVTSEELTVTPTKDVIVLTPINADYISKVTVQAIPEKYEDRTEIDASIGDVDNIIGDVEIEPITDLAGKKFLLKQSVAFSDFSYNINFEVSHAAPNTNVTRYHKCNKLIFATDTNTGKRTLKYNIVESTESAYVGSQITVYEGDNDSLTCLSTLDDLRLVSIIDGTDTTNETLIEWFNTHTDLVSDFDVLIQKLEKLVAKANETTGKNDTTISGAVDSLIDGYGEDSAIPIEVATEDEMTSLLENAPVGGVYKFTGTSEIYETGSLYLIEEGE